MHTAYAWGSQSVIDFFAAALIRLRFDHPLLSKPNQDGIYPSSLAFARLRMMTFPFYPNDPYARQMGGVFYTFDPAENSNTSPRSNE
jgi:hypothetical protein